MNTSLLKIFTPKLRDTIRHGLTYNWAGGYEYAFYEGAVIERIVGPAIFAWGEGWGSHFTPAPPHRYQVVAGQCSDPKAGFEAGARITIYGRSRGSVVGRHILGGPSRRGPKKGFGEKGGDFIFRI
jgi:hypothetical protein